MRLSLATLIFGLLGAGVLLFVIFGRPSSEPPSLTLLEESEPTIVAESRYLNADCNQAPTPGLTEGPYYKTGSPAQSSLRDSVVGEPLTLTGRVLGPDCQPVDNAWLDFWQADGDGVYDNDGFSLRGHQFSSGEGEYRLETVIPGQYSGRAPHIHVKLRARDGSPILTTQLFFPTGNNTSDTIFNEALVIELNQTEAGWVGYFDFILPDN